MNFYELNDFLKCLPESYETLGEKKCYELLSTLLTKYAVDRKQLTKEQDLEEIQNFQKVILPYALQSEFGKYILERPRGYVGDFVSQEMIWFGRTNGKTTKYNGTSKIGQIINALTYEMDNPKANEERIYILQEIIKNSGPKIASVGCGCAIELWNHEEYKKEIDDIFLLDFDKGALLRAEEKVKSNKTKIQFHHDNVLKFLLAKDNKILSSRDLIYVFGLCDYFNIKNSKRIVEGLWKFIGSSGLLVITNAHPDNPTRLWMEYAGNWFLEYKTKDDMLSLIENLPGVSDADVYIDKYGVYQYLKIRKR